MKGGDQGLSFEPSIASIAALQQLKWPGQRPAARQHVQSFPSPWQCWSFWKQRVKEPEKIIELANIGSNCIFFGSYRKNTEILAA